jgi:hypothetical protein
VYVETNMGAIVQASSVVAMSQPRRRVSSQRLILGAALYSMAMAQSILWMSSGRVALGLGLAVLVAISAVAAARCALRDAIGTGELKPVSDGRSSNSTGHRA